MQIFKVLFIVVKKLNKKVQQQVLDKQWHIHPMQVSAKNGLYARGQATSKNISHGGVHWTTPHMKF